MVVTGRLSGALADVTPVLPDADEARQWAQDELSKPRYQEAEPTFIDRIAQSFVEWLGEVFSGDGGVGLGPVIALVVVLAVIVVIVLSIVVWGRPKAVRRTPAQTALFGEDAARTAEEHRRAAASAAAAGDWDTAILERTRGLARALSERLLVEIPPGATVNAFARAAARALGSYSAEFARVAASFDDVRYLRRPGTEAAYREVADLDERVAKTRARELESAS